MKTEEFTELISQRLKLIHNLLIEKRKEYANDENVFSNFIKGHVISPTRSPFEILDGYRLKHEISIDDMRNKLLEENELPTIAKIREKYGDFIIYYLLEEAMMINEVNKANKDKTFGQP
jgi:hypothetical protein